jgi:hypothetical protein
VADGLARYDEALREAIDSGTAAVMARFDKLGAILLGEERTSKARAEPSIPELIELREHR